MIDGMGGVNVPGIKAGLDELAVPRETRAVIFRKLLILAQGLVSQPKGEANG